MLWVIEHPDGSLSDGQMTPGDKPIHASYYQAAEAIGGTVVSLDCGFPLEPLRWCKLDDTRTRIVPHPEAIAKTERDERMTQKLGCEMRRLALVSLATSSHDEDLDWINCQLAKLGK